MNFFEELEIFGWCYCKRDLMWMYFKNMEDMQQVVALLRNNYSQIKFLHQPFIY